MKTGLKLLELQLAVMSHCTALRECIRYLEADNTEACTARLDGAVAALHAVIQGQAVGVTVECEHCGESAPALDWATWGKCPSCRHDYDRSEEG